MSGVLWLTGAESEVTVGDWNVGEVEGSPREPVTVVEWQVGEVEGSIGPRLQKGEYNAMFTLHLRWTSIT